MSARGDDETAKLSGGVGTDATLTSPGAGTAAAPAEAPELATVERRTYRVERELARGGMGRIVIAKDVRLQRAVAVKEVLDASDEHFQRFEREALLTAALQHPNIVSVYEAGRWPSGEPFYAMRLVPGKPLDDVLEETKSWSARLALLPNVIAVAEALGYAHDEGVIHRDLKPQNVLVGHHGETVVIDWGLAKRLKDPDEPRGKATVTDASLTTAGSILGTPRYMPPEQAAGERVDARADVYAIGAILYFVLGGEPPYHDADSVHQILGKLISEESTRPLAEIAPSAPRDLVAIVERAMAMNPADRYANATELAADLRRFQTGQLVGTHTYSLRELVARWVGKHKLVLTIAAAALVTLVAMGMLSYRSVKAQRDAANAARTAAEASARAEKAASEDAQRAHASEAKLADLQRLESSRRSLETDPTVAVAWVRSLSNLPLFQDSAALIAEYASARGVARVVMLDRMVSAVGLSGDDRTLWVGDRNGGMWKIDVASSTKASVGASNSVASSISVSRSGAVALATTTLGVELWLANATAPRAIATSRMEVPHGAINAEGDRIAYTSDPHIVSVCQEPAHTCQTIDVGSAVLDVQISSDSSLVMITTTDRTMAVSVTGVPTIVRELPFHLDSLAQGERPASWTPDGHHVVWASVEAGQCTLSRSGIGEPVERLGGCLCAPRSFTSDPLALPDRGRRALTIELSRDSFVVGTHCGIAASTQDTRHRLPDGKFLGAGATMSSGMVSLALGREPDHGMAVGFRDGRVLFGHHDSIVDTQQLRASFAKTPIRWLAFADQVFVSVSESGEIRIWPAQIHGYRELPSGAQLSASGAALGVEAGNGAWFLGVDSDEVVRLPRADAKQVFASAEVVPTILVTREGAQATLWNPSSGGVRDVAVVGTVEAIAADRALVLRDGRLHVVDWDGNERLDLGKPVDEKYVLSNLVTTPDLTTAFAADAHAIVKYSAVGTHRIELSSDLSSWAVLPDASWLVAVTADEKIVSCNALTFECHEVRAPPDERVLGVSAYQTQASVFVSLESGGHMLDPRANALGGNEPYGVVDPGGRYGFVFKGNQLGVSDLDGAEVATLPLYRPGNRFVFSRWGTPDSKLVVLELEQGREGDGGPAYEHWYVERFPLGRLPRDASLADALARITNAKVVGNLLVESPGL